MEEIAGQTTSDSLIKIAIVGPESTGKTFLAKKLAAHFNTLWVPEYAREYLEKTGGAYRQSDLLEIARSQVHLEDELAQKSENLLFCDTNLLVIKIWSEHKYQSCHPWILNELKNRKYHLHLLCDIDLPWQEDPFREHPDLRDYLFRRYEESLIQANLPYVIVGGNETSRFQAAIKAVNSLR